MTSKDSISEAIQGSHTIFLVTTPNFMQPEADDELVQGKNVADAAKDAGVRHIIFSSLLNVTKISGGRLKHVLHFDRKAQVEDYIRSIDIPSTFILPGYFMTNYTALGMIRQGEDKIYTLSYPVSPSAQFPLIDAESDLGTSSVHIAYRKFLSSMAADSIIYRKICRCCCSSRSNIVHASDSRGC